MNTHSPTIESIGGYIIPHLDETGSCDCDCSDCTEGPYCICNACDIEACGLHISQAAKFGL